MPAALGQRPIDMGSSESNSAIHHRRARERARADHEDVAANGGHGIARPHDRCGVRRRTRTRARCADPCGAYQPVGGNPIRRTTNSARFSANIRARGARHGFAPTETAVAIFALRDAVLAVPGSLEASGFAAFSSFIDALGLVTFEAFVQARESVIVNQSETVTGTIHARRQTMGRYRRAAAGRHARLRAHASRHGVALANAALDR